MAPDEGGGQADAGFQQDTAKSAIHRRCVGDVRRARQPALRSFHFRRIAPVRKMLCVVDIDHKAGASAKVRRQWGERMKSCEYQFAVPEEESFRALQMRGGVPILVCHVVRR